MRHVAPLRFVGLPKAIAVMETLRSHNLDADAVTAQHQRIADPDEARRLYRNHDLVIDATADNRTTALLIWASEVVCKPMITVCVQRDGGIARADRTPLRHLEHHLAAVSPLADANAPLVERGCGDSVSPTPPASVIAAAELGVELIVDLLVGDGRLPPTLMRVLNEQPDEPSTTLPICTAQPCERAVPHG